MATVVDHNPLIDRDRKGYSLWTYLKQAYDRAMKTYGVTEGRRPVWGMDEYLGFSIPSENRGGYALEIERICTIRPRRYNADVATLVANQWVYIGNKGEEMANAGYDPITYGLYRETGPSEEHRFRQAAYMAITRGMEKVSRGDAVVFTELDRPAYTLTPRRTLAKKAWSHMGRNTPSELMLMLEDCWGTSPPKKPG